MKHQRSPKTLPLRELNLNSAPSTLSSVTAGSCSVNPHHLALRFTAQAKLM